MEAHSSRGNDRGFTIPEVMFYMLINTVVLTAAYNLMTSTAKESKKAQGLSAAVQAGALIFHALENDLANIVPEQRSGAVYSEDIAVDESHPGYQEVTFSRRHPQAKLEFDSALTQIPNSGIEVHYVARQEADSLWTVVRYLGAMEPRNATYFTGAYATAVRFSTLDYNNRHFLRVSLMLVGEDEQRDPHHTVAANVAKPYLLTALHYIPKK
jgi:Tfp pilus assembly protein PilV